MEKFDSDSIPSLSSMLQSLFFWWLLLNTFLGTVIKIA